MKANKNIDEGFLQKAFRNFMDKHSDGEYSRIKGEDSDKIKDPKIINHVSDVGFQDYTKRLRSEGIELSKQSSIDANIDRIKESVVEYIQAYMTAKEQEDARNEILVNLKNVFSVFNGLPRLNFNVIKKLFHDSATIRADTLVELQTRLKPSSKSPAITNMPSLMANLPDNHEIITQTSDKNLAGDDVFSIIRKDGVYLYNLPANIEREISAGKKNTPPTIEIVINNFQYTVYPVKSPANLQDIYNKLLALVGGTINSMILSKIVKPISMEL